MLARDHPDHDKLFKIRPFFDKFRQNLSKREPEEYQSIEEMIIPFKGRCPYKQNIKSKPHKWGIKVFARAGSS